MTLEYLESLIKSGKTLNKKQQAAYNALRMHPTTVQKHDNRISKHPTGLQKDG